MVERRWEFYKVELLSRWEESWEFSSIEKVYKKGKVTDFSRFNDYFTLRNCYKRL